MTIKAIHRYLSLVVAALWLVQAMTGILSVFRWEIDNATVTGASVPADYRALGSQIDAMRSAPDGSVSSLWSAGGSEARFTIYFSDATRSGVMLADGRGKPLRVRSSETAIARGAFWDSVHTVHTSLFAGPAGEWLIGFSGIFLLTNIILGLKLAWPRRGTWRRILLLKPSGNTPAKLYGWHRKFGLWLGIPALVPIAAGVMLAFLDAVESGLDARLKEPAAIAVAAAPGTDVGAGRAISAALEAYPGASFSGMYLPDHDTPWYRVRLRAPGEVPRKWGATTVFVSQASGEILHSYDASDPEPGRAVIDTVYPLHTGQIGGWVGRGLVFAIGLWLVGMIGFGIALWTKRRSRSVRKA